ncbi:Uncharacterised protein [Mycobacteroides abscessus subsp. abscessus]|nr:Uncharacterised protein [Mycobacteroides abscessus subsp. abscessus]
MVGQGDEQLPPQIGVDRDASDLLRVEPRAQRLDLLLGLRVADDPAEELERLVRARRGCLEELAEAVGDARVGFRALGRGQVGPDRGLELTHLREQARGVGDRGEVAQQRVDVVPGRDLCIAHPVPQRAEHEELGERVVEVRQPCRRGRQALGIEPDLRIREVGVVDDDDCRPGHTDGLGHVRLGGVEVEGEGVGAHEAPLAVVGVEADRQAVRAQGRLRLSFDRPRLLGHREPLDHLGAGVGGGTVGHVGFDEVDPGLLEPELRPCREVAPARRLEFAQQVAQLRVRPRVRVEVGLQAREELGAADPGDELLEHRGALGVGDAVEVDLDVSEVLDGGDDGVGARQLVLPVRPGLLDRRERRPGIGVLRRLGRGQRRHELGEGLVEPQVVPPAHRHEVAEPHVGELVEDGDRAALDECLGGPGAEDVVLEDRHRSGVLHRPGIELGDEELIVLLERVGHPELAFEELEARAGDGEEVLRVEVLEEGLTAVEPERHGLSVGGDELGVDAAVGAGDDRGDVGRDRGGRGELPHGHVLGRGLLGVEVGEDLRRVPRGRGRRVRDDRPLLRGDDGEGERRFEVGLLEDREDAASIGDLELGVEVDRVVDGVDEAVQALTGVHVEEVRVDDEFVLRGEPGEGDAGGGDDLADLEVEPVELDAFDACGDRVDEGLGFGIGGEPDPGPDAEGLADPGEDEGVLVALHGDVGRTRPGFFTGEVVLGHWLATSASGPGVFVVILSWTPGDADPWDGWAPTW